MEIGKLAKKRRQTHSHQSCEATTETSYKAGSVRRVSQSSQSRTQTTAQVNDELAQRNITQRVRTLAVRAQLGPLSGETCKMTCESSLAPASKACLKGWNVAEESAAGNAGVSRGRSSNPRKPIEMRRTER